MAYVNAAGQTAQTAPKAAIPGMSQSGKAPTMQDVYAAMGMFNQLMQSQQQQATPRSGYPTVVGGGGAGSALGRALVPQTRPPTAPAPLGQYLGRAK